MPRPTSAIPDLYYFCFAVYEPFLTIAGFIGTCYDPQSTYNAQVLWTPNNPPPDALPVATRMILLQLGHVCALMGAVNLFVLSAARWHLHAHLALQEKIVFSLLTPLFIGDFLHIYVTLLALGERRWDVWNWSPALWATVLIGLTLLLPRMAWHLGIGRYVDTRDGNYSKVVNIPQRK